MQRIELVDLGDGTWTWIFHHNGDLIFAAASDCADSRSAEAAGREYFAAHYADELYTVVTRPTISEANLQRLTDEAIAAAPSLADGSSLLIVFARRLQTWELRVASLTSITTMRSGDERAAPISGLTARTPPVAMRVLVENTTTQILDELHVHPLE